MRKTAKKVRSLLACCLAAALGVGSLSGASAAGLPREAAYEQGLWAEYYQGESYGDFLTGQKAESIDYTWSSSVTPPGLSSQEHFSSRYAGRLLVPETGAYIFYLNIDDGAKMWIDGQIRINDAGPHGADVKTAVVDLEAGKYVDFVIEHYNGYGDGTLQLAWRKPSNVKETIPAAAYFMPDAVRVDLAVEGGSVKAQAHMQSPGSDAYKLVLESFAEGTAAVSESAEAERSRNEQSWSTDSIAYEAGMSYRAYAVDGSGNPVCQPLVKSYGVDAELTVETDTVTGQITDTLYGVCMEDVNHELYGGIWSQMIFGESFAEPAYSNENAAVSVVGGSWAIESDGQSGRQYAGSGSDGPKLILNPTECTVGEVSADIYFEGGGPTGFIVKVSEAKPGADNFYGYEVGLGGGIVRLAKHENNYNKINDYSCNIQAGNWYNVRVAMTEDTITVFVDGTQVAQYTDPNPIRTGTVGFRVWDGSGKFKNIQFAKDGGPLQPLPVEENLAGGVVKVSGMWRLHQDAGVTGAPDLTADAPYTKSLSTAAQSQRITFTSGSGRIGVNNMGLNRMGMGFAQGKVYEGYVYARSEKGAKAYAVMENADGTRQYAEQAIEVEAGSGWKKYPFTLTPDQTDDCGRFSIELRSEGSVDLGYAFLEPGEWGRFEGLHVRKDVAETLQKQKVSVIRFGGGMIGVQGYRWKNMLGAPENRPTYDGCWYKSYSSLGFAIPEILMLGEKLGVPVVPDFNVDESPQDMADFMDFALGTDTSNEWVQARMALGHPEPFDLPYIQIGNENGINDSFAAKFNAIADKLWEKADAYGVEPILIVGDFGYKEPIMDPYHLTESDSGVLTLAGHKKILDHAVESGGREVWVDVHVFTDDPSGAYNLGANLPSLYEQLKAICPASKVKLTVFELNAWQHEFRRALGNAVAIMTGEKMSDVFPMICSANALQVDGQNDHGWDQGLVFMDADQAWMQPPAYVTQMMREAYLPNLLAASIDQKPVGVEFVATGSETGDQVAVKLVNDTAAPVSVRLNLGAFTGNVNTGLLTTLSSEDRALTNTADEPERIKPVVQTLENPVQNGLWTLTLLPNSFTVAQIQKKSEYAPQTLAEAKTAAEQALAALTVTNETDAQAVLHAALQAVTNKSITAAWTEEFSLTPATAEAEGRITGQITLTLDGETAVIQVDKVIAKMAESIVPGDMDGDGKVTIQDVMEACKVLARQSAGKAPTDDEMARGNLDGDGKFTITDVMEICKILARQA